MIGFLAALAVLGFFYFQDKMEERKKPLLSGQPQIQQEE